jgi:rubrerythrin
MPVCLIAPANELTVKNLLTAFENESNAHARYLAYATTADSEGFHRAARQLRALARSEQIHVDNYAGVIRKLGGDPETQLHKFEVQTTVENLTTALAGVIYAIDSLYPRLLVENRNLASSAARAFTWALEAKKTHARLLSEEIQQMEAGSAGSLTENSSDFYVRSVCGYVSKASLPERCWVCDRFCATFETIR